MMGSKRRGKMRAWVDLRVGRVGDDRCHECWDGGSRVVTGGELLLGCGDDEAQRLTAGWRAGSPRCWDNGALRELRRTENVEEKWSVT
jgi:hypothetical protein